MTAHSVNIGRVCSISKHNCDKSKEDKQEDVSAEFQ